MTLKELREALDDFGNDDTEVIQMNHDDPEDSPQCEIREVEGRSFSDGFKIVIWTS